MPTRSLPSRPNLAHLKHQSKDLLEDHRACRPGASRRIREFHPRFHRATDTTIETAAFSLADAQLTIAREYGFQSWARLKRYVETPGRPPRDLPMHERIEDAVFREAVDLLDDGDLDGLRAHLVRHPDLTHRRVMFEGSNYFRNPTLLEFVAENPVRHDSLPPNIVDVARLILETGARTDKTGVDSTLGLVCSGRVPREAGVQIPLIDLLCDHGADADRAMPAALAHGEFEAVDSLIRHGARVDLAVAAATNRIDDARRLLPDAGSDTRHRALALAARHGHAQIVRMLLDAGEDPDRYNPEGCHAHSTPLHQAALAGHAQVAAMLVEHGARLDIEDILYHGTPMEWAEHAGRTGVAEYLRSRGARR